MRLAGQIKGGFYAAPPQAIDLLLDHLTAPHEFTLLDPCAGEANAVVQLATGLNCPLKNVYAVELSDTRAAIVKQKIPNSLAPCAFEFTGISPGVFGFMWVNPPFDDQLGGGQRVEFTFLQQATRLLKTAGILAFCLPEDVLKGDRDMQQHILANYRQISFLPFPEEHRNYRELIVLAVKRSAAVPSEKWETKLDHVPLYEIPASGRPKRFEKVGLTPTELVAAVMSSPLRRKLLGTPPDTEVPRPPIPLGVGHTALLVASGQLDGVVRPPDEEPHVVRGTVRKTKYLARVESEESENGKSCSTTEVWSEKINPIVRIAKHDGEIVTLGNEGENDE